MRFSHEWIASYLVEAPTIEEMARLLNETGLETEVVNSCLEIEHTVNRPDAMNHFGLAREIAVKLGQTPVCPKLYEDDLPPAGHWTITSENVDECWRYLLLEVEGVQAVASPTWLKQRLEAIGQTCHNYLVDLTNYLLWEFGHPSHAFDANKLNGKAIRVREGAKGEWLTTLDGKRHQVAGHLCISDDQGPIALAGIMGGANSEVDEKTTTLALELAVFQPKRVRLSGYQLAIESDARHRFERGVDEETMLRIIRRFVYLLLEDQPQARLVSFTDMDLKPFVRKELVLRQSRLDKVLGIHLETERVSQLLTAMDCFPEKTSVGWRIQVPGYKVDVAREIDVIEEIIRFAGLDLLNSTLPVMAGTNYKTTPFTQGKAHIQQLLPALGFQETCTYSFLTKSLEARFGRGPEPVSLRNPMSENQAVMRRSLLPNLLECVRRNHNRGNQSIGFYEMGQVFLGPEECTKLAVIVSDAGEVEAWWGPQKSHPLYRAKGVLEALAETIGWSGFGLCERGPKTLPLIHCLTILSGDQEIGYLGTLDAQENEYWDFKHPVAVLEMDLTFLTDLNQRVSSVSAIPEFPGMKIDMAFVVDHHYPFADLKNHILGKAPENLQELSLFDVYQGKGIAKGKKSLGMRFRFQNTVRTLTSEEVSATMDAVVESVKVTFGAEIRE